MNILISRETTPPDLHFLHNLGVSHPRSAQQSTVVPFTSVHPSSTVQTTPLQPTPPLVNPPLVNPAPLHIMAAWYAPLVLPVPLVNLPHDYQSKIPLYDANNATTSSQHVDKMNDYFDKNEIDDDSVKLRLFAQSLGGEVRKWFKGLAPHIINDLQGFHQTFLNKWEVRKNTLQVLADYKNLHRNPGESVQAYCTRFNSVYNALSPELKPPQGSALNKFPEGFDADMTYSLRERDFATLEDMQRGTLSVEVNLMEKMMEEMMKEMSIIKRAQANQNQTAPQNIKQN